MVTGGRSKTKRRKNTVCFHTRLFFLGFVLRVYYGHLITTWMTKLGPRFIHWLNKMNENPMIITITNNNSIVIKIIIY